MGKKSYDTRRQELSLDKLLFEHHQAFDRIEDPRNRVIGQTMGDIAQAAFAMFHLKFPSLLDFDTATTVQLKNIQQLYHITDVCSDTQMRRMLDQVPPSVIHDRMTELINRTLQDIGGLRQYQTMGGRLIVSLDGVEHFHSQKVSCASCLYRLGRGLGQMHGDSVYCPKIHRQ